MAQEFFLPDIGEGLTEAVVISWHVAVGQSVGLDEPLVEIETDKAVVDIPSPYPGVVLHHGAGEDETIAVGALLAVVGEPGETWDPADRGPAPEAPDAPRGDDAAPIVGTLSGGADPVDAIQVLPAVRRLASSLGVDLTTLAGSGPGGRITEADVRGAADGRPVRRVPMSALRKSISDHLSRSWREIPHVTTFASAAAEPLLEERRSLGGPPLEALLIARLVGPLQEFPLFNSAISGDSIVERDFMDVGFAVDSRDGLMVAVVKDAHLLDQAALIAEVSRLAQAGLERALKPEELRGQTFTISNIGAVGGGYGTPLIPMGTSAILSVGRADPKPVVRDGELAIGREFPLSLSYDHRLVDGATGRRFIDSVIRALER